MEEFKKVLEETLMVVTQSGIPLIILFLIGYMLRLLRLQSQGTIKGRR